MIKTGLFDETTMMFEHGDDKVLLQGDVRYSFHAQAAEQLGVALERRKSAVTFDELYKRLRAGECVWAIVAVTNSVIGHIQGSYEQVFKGDLTIMGRLDLPIQHHLYAHAGTNLDAVRFIHTQRPAYLQCEETVRRELPHAVWVPETDTALSARIVRELGDPGHAAITPRAAGEAAGLVCVRRELQDRSDNTTTFLVVTTQIDT